MSMVPSRSDVFVEQKLAVGSVQGCTFAEQWHPYKKSKQLPAVLSREETAKIFSLLLRND